MRVVFVDVIGGMNGHVVKGWLIFILIILLRIIINNKKKLEDMVNSLYI